MTKEEAVKFLISKKLYVGRYSRRVQDKLFDLGFKWEGPEPRKHKLFFPFLYLTDNQIIAGSYNAEVFNDSTHDDFEQITHQDVLSIKIDGEEPPIQKKECDNIMESVYYHNTSIPGLPDNVFFILNA